MAIRKNKKRIDPRYFLHETANRDLNESTGEEVKISDLPKRYSELSQKYGNDQGNSQPVFMLGPNAFVALSSIQGATPGNALGWRVSFSASPNMGQSSQVAAAKGSIQPNIGLLVNALTALMKKGSESGIDFQPSDTVRVIPAR